jgi:hypothetical protein
MTIIASLGNTEGLYSSPPRSDVSPESCETGWTVAVLSPASLVGLQTSDVANFFMARAPGVSTALTPTLSIRIQTQHHDQPDGNGLTPCCCSKTFLLLSGACRASCAAAVFSPHPTRAGTLPCPFEPLPSRIAGVAPEASRRTR